MTDERPKTPVEVLTDRCHYVGLLDTQGYRIADVLNAPNTDFLEMHDAQTHLQGADASDVRWHQVSLRKERILLAIPRGNYEAPARRRDRYVEKPRYSAQIVLPGIILSGILFLPPRTTAVMLLKEAMSLPTFLGLTEVTVHGSTYPLSATRFDTVIFRRPAIESIHLTSQPLSKSSSTWDPSDSPTTSSWS